MMVDAEVALGWWYDTLTARSCDGRPIEGTGTLLRHAIALGRKSRSVFHQRGKRDRSIPEGRHIGAAEP